MSVSFLTSPTIVRRRSAPLAEPFCYSPQPRPLRPGLFRCMLFVGFGRFVRGGTNGHISAVVGQHSDAGPSGLLSKTVALFLTGADRRRGVLHRFRLSYNPCAG